MQEAVFHLQCFLHNGMAFYFCKGKTSYTMICFYPRSGVLESWELNAQSAEMTRPGSHSESPWGLIPDLLTPSPELSLLDRLPLKVKVGLTKYNLLDCKLS